jgi:glycosyltransferase involved in cell wall biosynthesis
VRIAQLGPLWSRIPPHTYGGIELIVHLLTEGLIRRGHEVTLYASGDSRTSARLRPIVPTGLFETMCRGEAYAYDHYATAAIAEAIRDRDQFDVILSNLGSSKIPLSLATTTPIVHTLQTMVTLDEQWVLRRYPEVTVIAVSHSQIASVPAEFRRNFHVAYNACDFEAYDLAEPPGQYLAFLGRMNPNKNPVDAIRIAQAIKMPLVLAGAPQARQEETYFRDEVQPLIDGKQVRYIGRVNHEEKRELLRNASAFVFPITWAEPFGIVAIEALASGLPVLAYSNGSVPEIIDQGITGFYANSVETLAALAPQALALNRKAIREHARKRFNNDRMVEDYVRIFRALIENKG